MSKLPHNQRLAFDDPDLRTPKHDAIMIWLQDLIESGQASLPHNVPRPRLVQIRWETPIVSGRHQYAKVVGFFDLTAQYVSDLRFDEREEDPLGGAIIAYEVKSKILSLGELLRQMQMYKAFVREFMPYEQHQLFVVAPEQEGVRNTLAANGFGFLPVPTIVNV